MPRFTETENSFRVLLAPKSVVPHCSPLVWLGGSRERGGLDLINWKKLD